MRHGSERRLSICLAALTLAFAAAAGPAAADPVGPLSHAGPWITDSLGRVVILHGVNMVYKLPPYYPSAVRFDEDDARFLRTEGFNTVRVGIIYKAVEPQPGVYDDAYLDRIAETVATLGRQGIFSMLDFHQDMYNERFQGEGFPDWAVQDDGLPAQPRLGFSANYFGMPALVRAFDHFWANDPGPGGVGLQDRYAAAWRHVAERFRADANVLGYELFNEPWPGSPWPTCANTAGCPVFDAQLAAFSKRSIAAIRQADSRTLVFYEPNVIFNDGADTNVGSLGDPSLGFAFHDYCLSESQTHSNAGCDPFDDLVFANALKHSAATGAALLMTEFGASQDFGNLQAMVDRADRNMVGWQYWAYCGCSDPTTSGPGTVQALVIDPAKPPTGDNVDRPKLALLARPYPQAVAGTPRSFSFDPATKTFQLTYSTAGAGGGGLAPAAQTEISIPPAQYPQGYDVDASGARVTSEVDASVLTVANRAQQVNVKVTPAASGRRRPPAGTTPGAGRSALRLKLVAKRLRNRRRVRLSIVGSDLALVRSVDFLVGRRRVARRRRPPFRAVIGLRPGRRHTVRAAITLRDGNALRLRRRLRR